jgi:hypothetical protein
MQVVIYQVIVGKRSLMHACALVAISNAVNQMNICFCKLKWLIFNVAEKTS